MKTESQTDAATSHGMPTATGSWNEKNKQTKKLPLNP